MKDRVIVYTRIINNINLQALKRASAFIDMVERKVDQEAVDLLGKCRDTLAMGRVTKDGGITKRFEVSWIGREGLSPNTHKDYLTTLVNHFHRNVIKLIDRGVKKDVLTGSPLALELLFHLH